MQDDDNYELQAQQDEESYDLMVGVVACCHLYRECSEAGHCICASSDTASKCAYRKNLEAGRVFYGKQATNFHAAVYSELERKVEALSPEAKKVFKGMIADFCKHHRGVQSIIFRSAHLDEIESLGLFSISLAGSSLVSMYRGIFKKLSGLFASRFPEAFAQWGEEYKAYREALLKEKVVVTRPKVRFFEHWMNTVGTQYRDALADPYRIVTIVSEKRIYLEELWVDHYEKSWKKEDFTLSALAQDGMESATRIREQKERIRKLGGRL